MAHGKYLTYSGYLHLDELLSLQVQHSGEGGSREHGGPRGEGVPARHLGLPQDDQRREVR